MFRSILRWFNLEDASQVGNAVFALACLVTALVMAWLSLGYK